MLHITHQEIIDSKILQQNYYFLEDIFIKYDATKQQFLDTLIHNYELDYTFLLIASAIGSIEELEYIIFLNNSNHILIQQHILNECLNEAIENILPDNVKLLLDLINTPTFVTEPLMDIRLDFHDNKDIHKRDIEEKRLDFITMSNILFNNNSKMNRYTYNLIHFVVYLLDGDPVMYNILAPYFFTQEGIVIMKTITINDPQHFKNLLEKQILTHTL